MLSYTYTETDGRKHQVPSKRAFTLDQIRRGDHICFPRPAYWHHAIVETADKSNGKVNVIEYSNSAKQFIQDNSSPPKNPGLAVVVRGTFKLENESVYVIKHDRCYDPETVVSRANSRLGERKYRPVTNNCEHFALWCKTGISSSEQVNNVKDASKVAVNTIIAGAVTKQVVDQLAVKTVQDSGGSRGGDRGAWASPLILNQAEARGAEKLFFETGPPFPYPRDRRTGPSPLSEGLDPPLQEAVETRQEAVKTGIGAVTNSSGSRGKVGGVQTPPIRPDACLRQKFLLDRISLFIWLIFLNETRVAFWH